MRFIGRTPIRTFVIYPIVTLVWELIISRGSLTSNLWYLPLMLWGYLQYRLCGGYRVKHGGGGPGVEKPPDRLVSSGLYAYCRNPMYLGHIIFLSGLVSEANRCSEKIFRVRFFPSPSPKYTICSWDGLRSANARRADLQRSSIW